MQTVYLICGSTGAGKSTYSRKLGGTLGALVFSIDEWMKTLFWMDAGENTGLDWALERVRRCEDQIWTIAKDVLAGDRPVILDLGFSKADQRQKFRDLVATESHQFELHLLDLPADVRRRRVNERNLARSGTFEFELDEKTFDWMESYFERPTGDELIGAVVVTD